MSTPTLKPTLVPTVNGTVAPCSNLSGFDGVACRDWFVPAVLITIALIWIVSIYPATKSLYIAILIFYTFMRSFP